MPQWNCSCRNCQAARQGRLPSQTQSSVAIGDADGLWFIVNASPDLGFQLQSCPELHPRAEPIRNSPVGGVLLTNADLDHVLGLFSLREGDRFTIYAPRGVGAVVENALGLETVLSCFSTPVWREPSFDNFAPLTTPLKTSATLLFRAIDLPGKPPPFYSGAGPDVSGGQSVAYEFQDAATGKRLLVAPDVAQINSALEAALHKSDAILFDGTFWSPDELTQVRPGAKRAAEMGHMTIHDGSLRLLAGLPAKQKIYIHINNTNPVWARDSAERAAVERAGLRVGYDGLEFEL